MNNRLNENKMPEHSGFENPICAAIYPKGTTFIHQPDGSMTPVIPDGEEVILVSEEQYYENDARRKLDD